MEAGAKDSVVRCDLATLLEGPDPRNLRVMTSSAVRGLEGRQVCVALRNGARIDDCQLISAGRASAATVWVFSNGADLFLSIEDVVDVWER
jgi:hypothetical protein